MAHDHDFGVGGTIFFGGETTSHHRLYAEHVKEAGGNEGSLDPFRFSVTRQVEAARIMNGEVFENAVARAQIHILGWRDSVLVAHQADAGEAPPHEHQAIRVAERQRPEQHPIDHAEDRRSGSDSESQRQDGEARESGIAEQSSKTVSQIGQSCAHT